MVVIRCTKIFSNTTRDLNEKISTYEQHGRLVVLKGSHHHLNDIMVVVGMLIGKLHHCCATVAVGGGV